MRSVEQELLEAKCHLYGLLLKKGGADWTGAEINLAYELSQDEQVQLYLRANLRPNKPSMGC